MGLDQISKKKIQYDACISSTTLEHIPKEELTIVYKAPTKDANSTINFDPKSVILNQLKEAGF